MTNTTPPPPATAELARFASTLDWHRVPREVQAFMPILLIDAFRVPTVGFDRPWTRAAFELHRGSSGSANASVLYSEARIEATRAAFALAPVRGAPLVLSPDDFEQCLRVERIRALSARTTCTVDAKVERAR